MLKYALLGFLNYMPMSGYDIEGYINVSTGNFWHARLSQIYTTLKKLEEDGLVTSHIEAQEGRPDKRIYTITESGQQELQGWQRSPVLEIATKKDDLLLKIFFANPADKQGILTQLRLQLDLHRKQLEFYKQAPPQEITRLVGEHPDLMPNALLWESVRRYGELYEEAYIRWLEETIERLDDDLAHGSTP